MDGLFINLQEFVILILISLLIAIIDVYVLAISS